MNGLIPTTIIDILIEYIKIDTTLQLTEKQQQKLLKVLLELWYFIYTKQTEDDNVKNLKFYININSEELNIFNFSANKKRFGYNKLLDILLFNELIDINESFKQGQFSKSYRINLLFLENSKLTEFELDFNKIFNQTRNKEYWTSKYPHITNLIDDIYNTTIKLEDYLLWMNSNEGIELKPIIEKGIIKRRFLTKERIYHHFNLALKLNFKNIWVKISDEGRLYSTISNLPYTSIPFLLINGIDTQDIDISNSQPLLLTILLTKKHNQYKKDVEDGIFYDKIANILNIKRNEFKMLSYKYIFFSHKPLNSGKIYDTINIVYPGLIDEINSIKENTLLANKLQELEADIFVKKVGMVNIPKILRHDQVIVNKQNYNIIKKFLQLEYKKLNIKVNIN